MKEDTMVRGEKRNPLVHLFSQTWKYSAGNHNNVRLYWAMFIIGNAIELVCHPLLLAKIMDTIQKNGVSKNNIYEIGGLLLLTLLVTLIFWSMHGPARVMERANAYKVRANYRKSLLKGVMDLPLEWHARHHSGNTIDQIEKGANAQYAFSSESFQTISAIVQFVVSYGMLAYFSWPSAIIVLVMVGMTIMITMRFDRKIIVNYKILNKTENHIAQQVFDTISNITTVVILRVERLVFKAISDKIDSPYALYCKNSAQMETKWFLTNVCSRLMAGTVLIVYCVQQLNTGQTILISSVFLLMKYLDQIENLFFRFTDMYGETIQRHAKVLNAEELSKDFRPVNFTNHVLPDDWKDLQVTGLNFSYHAVGENKEKDLHLDNVSLAIKRGERIALVGESGSGKTTFLLLMRGLFQPSSIELRVDGVRIEEGFNGISSAITLVPQSPEIFATTIEDNITLGAEYDPVVVRKAIEMARFDTVVDALPDRLKARVNEKGVKLSVGQRQRLALARGFLACIDKSVILVDEPTSNIDGQNEHHIYKNLIQEFGEQTIVASIHGLHLLTHFDRIVMFQKGKIIASGTEEELIYSCPEFKTLRRRYMASGGKKQPVEES